MRSLAVILALAVAPAAGAATVNFAITLDVDQATTAGPGAMGAGGFRRGRAWRADRRLPGASRLPVTRSPDPIPPACGPSKRPRPDGPPRATQTPAPRINWPISDWRTEFPE